MTLREGTPVSVVIPCFNCSATIGGAIASISETKLAVEVVCVNDCSTDDTGAVLDAIAAADPRVLVIHLAQNSGPSGARNAGFAAATGDYMAILDSDDAYLPGRLWRLCSAIDAAGAEVAIDNLLVDYRSETRRPAPAFPGMPSGPISLERVLEMSSIYAPTYPVGWVKPVFRRDFVVAQAPLYDKALRFGEDFNLLVRCCLAGPVEYIDEPGYRYFPEAANAATQTDAARAAKAADRRVGLLLTAYQATRDRIAGSENAGPALVLFDGLLRELNLVRDYQAARELFRSGRRGTALVKILRQPRLLGVALARLRRSGGKG